MPENETLLYDDKAASRWNPVGKRLDAGEAPSELFPTIEASFHSLGQKIWKQWKNRGIDPGLLFDAALNDATKLQNLIKQSLNDRNAQLVRDVAAELCEPDMKGLVDGFLNSAWEQVEMQLQLNRRADARPLELIGQVHRMLKRIASSLLKDPSRFPKCPSRNEPPPDLDSQLGESLL